MNLGLEVGYILAAPFRITTVKSLSILHTGTGSIEISSPLTAYKSTWLLARILTLKRLISVVDVMNSACGVCGQQSIENLLDKLPQDPNAQIPEHQLLPLAKICTSLVDPKQLTANQGIFAQTGGSHGVALFDQGLHILDVREDVGRHNAFDKLIGANMNILAGDIHPSRQSIWGVVLSSRASFELVQKAAMVNIRFIIAMSAHRLV